jgi:hypothetical protein
MRRLIRMFLAGAAALGATAGRAEAASTLAFEQQGADVGATGSGSIDLTDLFLFGKDDLRNSGVNPKDALAGVPGPVAVYSGITGPASFGSGGYFKAFMAAATRSPCTVRRRR